MHAIAPTPIEWRDVQELFGPNLVRFQAPSQALLLRAEVRDVGFAVHWLVAAVGHYLFFAPRYRYIAWSDLAQWHRLFFLPERVQQIKQFARGQKWPFRMIPVLEGISESLVDFGADFDGRNELIAVEEYVLPAEHAAEDRLLSYLREWEQTFAAYMYRDLSHSLHTGPGARLMTALHTNPLVVQEAAMKSEVKRSTKLLIDVLDRWSADEVLTHLATQDTFPGLLRHDLVPGVPTPDSARKDWQGLYELRVAFLEKFAFPWFYRPALAMLGAEGPRHSLTASQLVEQGARPLSQPVCPEEFRARVGLVALRLEQTYPILAREPVAP
ncbi:hypothetical protein [Ramlibacter sp. WS9]|uniref:hypothetical protein n=1 Tax=Ramlibacter sp. WS9 TaxID=1882741 RepID=UPI0011437934|nr:hypothetical protein [Ramlibacter sp. WS9]ROZ79734.1 hypothetical protein EEB15_02180 [Ramlibacter sp. WS9]